MTAITVNIPNSEVRFFQKVATRMGWKYGTTTMVSSVPSAKELTLRSIDRAFGQLRQMQEGGLGGRPAEELIDEL